MRSILAVCTGCMYRSTKVPYQGTVVEMAQYEASEYAQSRWLVEG